jgi:hypothetical protein
MNEDIQILYRRIRKYRKEQNDLVEQHRQLVRQYIENHFETVQFCPCGHVNEMSMAEIIRLGAIGQLQRIAQGTKVDAITLPQNECPNCREAWQKRDQLNEMYLDSASC